MIYMSPDVLGHSIAICSVVCPLWLALLLGLDFTVSSGKHAVNLEFLRSDTVQSSSSKIGTNTVLAPGLGLYRD
jgi:hypothetical protein